MRAGPLDSDTSFQLKIAAAWYNKSPSECMRIALQKWLDDVADSNPFLRELMTLQR